MHWIDRVARALMKRGKEHVVASGISISGHVHIGHCNDVFIADGIRKAVEELGGEAVAIWYADDYDPMRRVPWPLNQGENAEKFEQYLGFPYVNIPSPDPAYRNFVDYFSKDFVRSLREFGIKVRIYSGAEVYRSGKMAELIRTALKSAERIRRILNRYRETPLPDDWLPYDPICANCGRISTTRACSWKGDLVSYRCEGTDYVQGCGHTGEADFTRGEGKLTWRVEWPARWKLLGVTCEPFGKDHAAAGGSYDTGKQVARWVFRCRAPYPVPYEWVSLGGRHMSSSRGIVFTLPQWLQVAEPELLRYFIFRSKPMKAREFDPSSTLVELYEEFDMVERVYFGLERARGRKAGQMKRIYELSQPKGAPDSPIQRVPFRLAATLAQVMRDEKHAIEILKSRNVLRNPTPLDIRLAARRISCAKNWVLSYAPETMRFQVAQTMPPEARNLDEKQKKGLEMLAADLSKRSYTPVELHNHIYEVSRAAGAEPSSLFRAIYISLLGRPSGPKAGNFLSVLDRDFVISRFREVASSS
ncbi:MAG: lysine--tRNA ligase [Candidatus Hadarchaeales archaeon]